ncbi:FAD-dependent oxidoreductase [Vampirovibrio chlorellavorus]|uniref:FAD-dependent oxidoreductase n=1 Tax=Vampirovibrio chlorellavorus TaxID=758823 RepID=UPI0026EE52F4|nr:FAD-dependent oxidoreductase [Vampirovibrio chlorellavorus]
MRETQCQVLVVGDEIESILTAISASRAGAVTVLARRSTGPLGGLSVRGGLSYMDITPELLCGLFQEFLSRCGFIRVALNPDKAHAVLQAMLAEAKVRVISGMTVQLTLNSAGFPEQALLTNPKGSSEVLKPEVLHPRVVIDASPDADVARSLGLPFVEGLGGILGAEQNFLGVSPVFRITGLSVEAFQAFEARLRQNPELPQILAQALPYHPSDLRTEYLTRPTFAPPDQDYLDILNPVIGIDYHLWRNKSAASYASADIFIDGGNVSRLSDGSLGFNGLVAQVKALNLDLEGLIALSQGGPTPAILQAEMRHFERYLREQGPFPQVSVIPPSELYVRQTVNLLSRETLTARRAIEGGVAPEKAIGTFSYWLDLRGTQLWQLYPNEHLPKPIFNVGLEVALPATTAVQNFAFVSRSAGYSPIGQGTGRIVQHNALLGEGVGVAAALASLSGQSLLDTATQRIADIQACLAHRQGGTLRIEGKATWSPAQIEANSLLKADKAIVDALRKSNFILKG